VAFSTSAALDAADVLVSGLVVDQSGRPVPRAYVRVHDAAPGEIPGVFADESGRFEVLADDTSTCRIEATLTGFQPASIPCTSAAGGSPRQLVLAVAPIQETTIVTATLTAAPSSQVGASATVFTADDLERRQTPLLVDLLRLSPGAMVIRNGGPGSLTSLFVRGGESDYNKVLLDGIPLNEPGGNFYLNNLTTENLERVEILRGAYSSLFGSDAMASVIQLFTKRPDLSSRRPRVSGQLDGGTYSTAHMNSAVSGASGRFDYSVGAARFSSDNRVPNSRLENTTLSTNLGVALGETATLRFVGRGELEHVGTPGQTAFGRPDLDAFFDRDDAIAGVTFDQQLTNALRQRVSYSLAASNQTSTNLVADPPFTATFQGRAAQFQSSDFPFDNLTDLRRHHASYQADWRIGRDASQGNHLLTMLVDWDGERARLQDRLTSTRTMNSRDNFGAAVQHQMLWPRVFITLGGRVEHNETFGTEVVPRATVVFVAHPPSSRPLGETRVRTSIGTGIKEPSMLESFSLSPFARGNPDLKPERSRSAEVGVEQRFASDRAKVELTWFDNRFRDLIWSQTTNFSTFEGQYFNLVDLSRARGVEAGITAAPVAALRARAGYAFVASEVQGSHASTVVFEEGAWAFRRPRHSGFVGATVEQGRLSFDVSGVFLGRFVDSDFGLFSPPILEIPAHATWDARVALRLTSQLTGILIIDNVTNLDYMEPIGYQPLRRVVRAGLKVGF
jgi:vitamin B12 transporter